MATTTVMLTSQIGVAQINTPNPNLDGTGVMIPFFTGAPTNGSLVTSITVKATQTVTNGMVRIFLRDTSSNTFLLEEFRIFGTDVNNNYGVLETFSATLQFPMGNFKLAPGWILLASTQKAENFNVIAEGFEQSYCPC